ncbi:helix-turn-helix domain-containing protein [Desulfofustis limnaeus]|jgi:transcriptional regulator with XRE-family HTH domain|uniref:HTH cro/C1-type domain-containing protein n=1 Tax=Desulfofustis limnaeus TaxID=2740163 RepID=A0ABN6M327_9BACT|nr:helix-turn-helix domain-containing protein [Desulfofustis limnaeus]MDX9896958.1 helix-turn-helix domain-containing protein [Desulfofustis sp.]BDD85709.1 hypothetical protein DPPLL_00740 [Desulfofustis limnaeus]
MNQQIKPPAATLPEKRKVSSGIKALDRLLGNLFIGDNVLWYEEAGSFSSAFCLSFIGETLRAKKPLIYVTFDRSPKNLVSFLGPLAESQNLTILDCFSNGKGDRSDVFDKFYQKDGALWPYQVVKINEPADAQQVGEAMYGLHGHMSGQVHFIIDSLTGMQALWGEDRVLDFYIRTCPRLYELDTIAYWLIEKGAHSAKLKANINKVAQVVIDLSVRRDTSSLKIIKAEKRHSKHINEPHTFTCEESGITFESPKSPDERFDLGTRIKAIRSKQGLSQKQLADLTGVTPSTISQVEKNLIYPSLPALFRIAESLSVDPGALFTTGNPATGTILFPAAHKKTMPLTGNARNFAEAQRLVPPDSELPLEMSLLKIPPGRQLSSHFFSRKGKEVGYLLSGQLEMRSNGRTYTIAAGDTIVLTEDTPDRWHNKGENAAELLWLVLPPIG